MTAPYCHQFLKINFVCYRIVSSFDCNRDCRILGCSFDLFPVHAFSCHSFCSEKVGTRTRSVNSAFSLFTGMWGFGWGIPQNEWFIMENPTRNPVIRGVVKLRGRSTWEAVGSCAAWRLRWFFRDSEDQARWISPGYATDFTRKWLKSTPRVAWNCRHTVITKGSTKLPEFPACCASYFSFCLGRWWCPWFGVKVLVFQGGGPPPLFDSPLVQGFFACKTWCA